MINEYFITQSNEKFKDINVVKKLEPNKDWNMHVSSIIN